MAPRLLLFPIMIRLEAMSATLGPWQAQDWDARSWRPPVPSRTARGEARPARELGIVILYVASLLVGSALMFALMVEGW